MTMKIRADIVDIKIIKQKRNAIKEVIFIEENTVEQTRYDGGKDYLIEIIMSAGIFKIMRQIPQRVIDTSFDDVLHNTKIDMLHGLISQMYFRDQDKKQNLSNNT